ncbi:MAG: DnaT-like ssDNA-binding protein [Citrobacter braakii]
MPSLIVEDGTMPPGANVYADVETCDAWQQARGSEAWTVPDDGPEDPDITARKEAALILAADYLNGLRWKGRRAASGRVMAWPRVEVIDGDGYPVARDAVPQQVVNANCYLAGLAFDGMSLQPSLERGGRIQSEKVSSLQTTYFDDARDREVFTVVSDLLGGLAIGLGGEQGVTPGGMRVVEVVRG